MWPDRVSYPGPLVLESGALPTALCGPARSFMNWICVSRACQNIYRSAYSIKRRKDIISFFIVQ